MQVKARIDLIRLFKVGLGKVWLGFVNLFCLEIVTGQIFVRTNFHPLQFFLIV